MLNDGFHAGLDIAQSLWMAVNVELIVGNRLKHHFSHLGCRNLAAADRFVAHGLANQLTLGGFLVRQIGRTVAVALANAGGHKVWAQNAGTDLVGDQFQILIQSFG